MANQLMTIESDLIAAAIALGATDVPGISCAEIELTNGVLPLGKTHAQKFKKEILAGGDPLGAAFSIIRRLTSAESLVLRIPLKALSTR